MRNSLLFLSIVAVFALGTASCKKTYECHCEGPGVHQHFDIKAKKKSDAESECKKKQIGAYTKCELES
ncbi:MAG: hypothetical protein N3F09_07315 [Bacteroidia bacterium]|nr:hypothetical protein [Bacteroidia bacterium]